VVKLTVQRGPESWNYFYLMLGLSIGLEAAIIAMVPLAFHITLLSSLSSRR